MAKRRLSLQQKRRIAEQRQQKRQQKEAANIPDEQELGELQTGVVISHFGTQVDVENDDQTLIQRCHVRANLSIVTGDHIRWRAGRELGVVESHEPRRSALQRPDIYGKLRTVAANITQLIITLAPEPEPFAHIIDRYLVAAHIHQLDVVLLGNKADLLDQNQQTTFTKLLQTYAELGYRSVLFSAKTGLGEAQLKAVLAPHTSIFVGQSGVGKSSIIQHLLPEQTLRIGELSDAKKKGRHTTTHSQLYHFPFGGDCIDSPGIREFGLWHASGEDILAGFIEIAHAAEHCKFRNCAHQNEPGCGVMQAIENGNIAPQRIESYRMILDQLGNVTIQTEKR